MDNSFTGHNVGKSYIELYNGNSGELYFGTAGADRMMIKSDGKVGIGTTNPTRDLTVVGDVDVSGDIYCGGALIPYSPIIVESAEGEQSIIAMKSDNGEWVGCGTYYNSETKEYEWKCIPNQEVNGKVSKIENRRTLKTECDLLGESYEFDESTLSCVHREIEFQN